VLRPRSGRRAPLRGHAPAEALWLGAAGFQGAAGTGTDDVYAQVEALCASGTIMYRAVGSVPGQAQQVATVSPGGKIDTYFRLENNVYFTGAWVNGCVLGGDTYPTERLNQDNRHVEISTSPLSGVSENKFHLVFDSNY
jgi:hypothetical protein